MQPTTLSLAEAEQLLAHYTCLESRDSLPPIDKPLLQQALQVMKAASDRQIFGVCADSLDEGVTALTAYLHALGYRVNPKFEPLDGPVYLKYNPYRDRCHRDSYSGYHRGVLVSCQSDFEDGVNDTYGHLPLDLFA